MGFLQFTLLSEVPSYLIEELKFDAETSGYVLLLIMLIMLIILIGLCHGYLSIALYCCCRVPCLVVH